MTIITKLLLSIVQQESQNVANKTFQGPPRDVIDSIYESSCGDLRSAINTLQFACLRGEITNKSWNTENIIYLLIFHY
jgi:DNA polymerase III delta prime subunit